MSTYSQDGFTPDPGTPVYEDISMDDSSMPTTGTSTGTSTSGGKKDAAKEEAAGVAHDAATAGKQVAGTAKEQAKKVTSEATTQAKGLLGQAGSELKHQAGAQQDRVAQGLRSLGGELSSMAANAESDGPASQLVRTVAGRADSAASWLEGRDPGSLLGEVKSFAARRPGTFIAIAALAGIVAGRLTTSLVTEAKEQAAQKDMASGTTADSTRTNVMPVANPDSPLTPSPEVQGEAAFPPVSAPTTGTGLGTGYPAGTGRGEGTEGSRL